MFLDNDWFIHFFIILIKDVSLNYKNFRTQDIFFFHILLLWSFSSLYVFILIFLFQLILTHLFIIYFLSLLLIIVLINLIGFSWNIGNYHCQWGDTLWKKKETEYFFKVKIIMIFLWQLIIFIFSFVIQIVFNFFI